MNKLKIKIITPEKTALTQEADSVSLPATAGQITILPNHIPLITALCTGEIIIKNGSDAKNLHVASGFAEVSKDTIRIMTDAAELAEDINIQRAEEAKKRAQQAKEQASSDIESAEATAALERALSRIRIAQRKRRHH